MEDRRMSLAWKLGLIYLVSEILLSLTRRSRSKTGTKQDRSTLGIIWLVIAVSIMAGVFVAHKISMLSHCRHGQILATAGVVLFVAGLILRWWAIITLGRFFTVDVIIEKDHELVERSQFGLSASSFLLWRVAGVRGSRTVASQLGCHACCSHTDWRGFRSPDEC